MPAATVMLVTGQKPLPESAQRLVMRSFNHKVRMIRYQASGNLLIFLGRQTFLHRVLADFNVLNGAKRLNDLNVWNGIRFW